MRRIWAVAAVAATVWVAGLSGAGASGAIAYGGGRAGLSYNYRDRDSAEERALAECGAGCRVVARYSGSCAAVATGRGVYGYAWREERRGAMRAALENCELRGGGACSVVTSGCDER